MVFRIRLLKVFAIGCLAIGSTTAARGDEAPASEPAPVQDTPEQEPTSPAALALDVPEDDAAASGPSEDQELAIVPPADEPAGSDTPASDIPATDATPPDTTASDAPVSDAPVSDAPVSGNDKAATEKLAAEKPAEAKTVAPKQSQKKSAQSQSKKPVAAAVPPAPKQPVLVPGTGALVKGVGDDFEDEKWSWNYRHPKSSEEQDKRMRGPMGKSVNGRWFEGPKRGTPDVVKRIELPSPGLEGSTHGLLIATLNAGIPGRVTYEMQQDDLIYNMMRVTGLGISVADSPSVVTRVYLPPFEQWENRSGPSFGFRAGCYTHAIITGEDHPDKGRWGLEEYWPGMFICFESSHDGRHKQDGAYLRIRGGRNGGEIRGPRMDKTGWWTLGLSFSPDGRVHYFAKPGVEELTMDDHITSQTPYGYRTERLKTFFYNVCTKDDVRTWSTPWVVDDPKVYFAKRPQMAAQPAPARR